MRPPRILRWAATVSESRRPNRRNRRPSRRRPDGNRRQRRRSNRLSRRRPDASRRPGSASRRLVLRAAALVLRTAATLVLRTLVRVHGRPPSECLRASRSPLGGVQPSVPNSFRHPASPDAPSPTVRRARGDPCGFALHSASGPVRAMKTLRASSSCEDRQGRCRAAAGQRVSPFDE